jgi:hypothetical protein
VATQCLDLLIDEPCIIIDPKTAKQKQIHLHPYLHEIIAQHKAWSVPCPKKELFTIDMFGCLTAHLCSGADDLDTFLHQNYAVYDWSHLRIFTGSQVAEYAQICLKKGMQYNAIPSLADAGSWVAGQPLAFIRTNFTFYNHKHTLIEHS